MTVDVDPGPDEGGETEFPVDMALVADLRRARRHRRVAEVHWIDALYRAYVAGLVALLAVIAASGAVGDAPLTAAQIDDVERWGPAAIGLIAALAVALGLRSGSRGGPLALEAADVRHVLLSGVDRGQALRGPAWRQVRSSVFLALLAGGALGRFAERRFDGNVLAWVAAGAATAAVLVALALGAALVGSGRRVPRWAASVIGGALVVWAAGDLLSVVRDSGGVPASPGRAVGWLALAPVDARPQALAAVVAAVLLVVAGSLGVGGSSIEAAERRTALVGQMRFAATLQDVRTVLVLRRQLSADQPRVKPWLQLRSRGGRRPALLRAWQGLMRFPASRLIRMVILALVAGLSLRAAWSGTAPMIVVAGLATWLIGLDTTEPLAQEVDHPGRRLQYRIPSGQIYVGLLGPSIAVSVLLGGIVGLVAAAPGSGQVPVAPAVLAGIGAALAGVAGAALNVVSGAPSHRSDLALIAPEIAGVATFLKAALPVVVSITGALPLLAVAANERAGRSLWQDASTAWVGVLLLLGLVAGWVHQRDEIAAWWAEAQEASKSMGSPARGAGDDDSDDDAADADDGADSDQSSDDDGSEGREEEER